MGVLAYSYASPGQGGGTQDSEPIGEAMGELAAKDH